MADWIGLAEAAYRLEGGMDDWVAGLCDAGAPMLDQGLGVAVHTFRATRARLFTESVAVFGGPPDFETIVRATNETAGPAAVARFLSYGTSVQTMSQAIFEAMPDERESFMASSRSLTQDVLGVLVLCGRGYGMSISIPIPEARPASVAERRHLGRVGAHLAAGMRLRLALAGGDMSLEEESVEAIFDPDGALREARGPAREREPHERLRDAVRRLEHARGTRQREDPDSLGLWEGLVRGRWSLIDRFDTDGRRFIVARRNEPLFGDPRGLSPREQQVAEFVGAGRSNKEIAYEFGVSESAVANAASRAQRKLGLQSRVELAGFFAPGGLRARLSSFEFEGETFAAGLEGLLDESRLAPLPAAERDVVLQLLSGATNAEIGRLRGTSEHTVAKQVKSVFERLGVGSRIELAASLATLD